jgi:tetratricopeptide (TPR) repeat protein
MMRFIERLSESIHDGADRLRERLANLGAAIVSPIERAFAATFGRLFRVTEGFERVEDLLIGLVRLLTWPFRMVWRLFAGIAGALVPASLIDSLAGSIHGAGAALWGLAERLNLDVPARWLAWALQPVWRPIAAVGGFLYSWLATRPYRSMAWGVPAILLFMPVAGAVLWGTTLGKESVTEHYRAAAQDAREAEDYDKLRFLEDKLVQLGADTKRTDYQAAIRLEEGGRVEEAFERMQRLAPEASVGFGPAHQWIFLKLLGGELKLLNDERLRLAGVHLAHLEKLGAKGPEMDFFRGVFYAQSDRLEEAADELAPLITSNLGAALHRLEVDLKLERLDEARRDARAIRDHLQEVRRRQTPLTVEQYRAWAQAEQLLGDANELIAVARAWLADFPDDAMARRLVATIDAQQFDEMLKSTHPDADLLAERLLELSRLADNPGALEPQLIAMFAGRKTSPAVAAMFDKLIASSETPTPLIAAMGTAAAMSKEIELARTLLARVVEADPKHAAAWNNFAWALTQEPNKDLNKALDAVNRALELSPQEFRFRETRGQIMVGLGRWQEAVDDLEFALNGMPDMPAIHVSLAAAYEKLGQTELAEIHRQQAP